MRAWAMCADRALGLTHVRSSLSTALEELVRCLKRIASAQVHGENPPTPGVFVEAAREKLKVLEMDWTAPIRGKWSERTSRRQSRVLAQLGAPSASARAYQLPAKLADLIEAVAPVVERLDHASAKLWAGSDSQETSHAAEAALSCCAEVRAALVSLDLAEQEPTALPSDRRNALTLAAEELLDVLQRIGAFVSATAASYRGSGKDHLHDPIKDNAVLSFLSIDLVGSSEHLLAHRETHTEWANDGLDFVAQWARAFDGREGKAREGDDLWLEFAPGDAPILCGSAIQQHGVALRSTGIEAISWWFRAAIDSGERDSGGGGNVITECLNRATKLAGACDEDGSSDKVFVAPEAIKQISTQLAADGMSERLEKVEVGAEQVRPTEFDPEAVMEAFAARVDQLGEKLAALSGAAGTERPLDISAEQDSASDARRAG